MTRTQLGVAAGMLTAMALTTGLFWVGLGGGGWLPRPPAEVELHGRLLVAVASWIGPLLALAASIGLIANLRFFSPADIDGAGLTEASPRVRVPRAILANTHEQATLAMGVYAALALLLPPGQIHLPLLLSAAFLAGRLLFAIGYARGAAARSLGFALGFYPSVGGLGLVAWLVVEECAR